MSEVVAYTMADGTEMRFEIDPLPGFRPSAAGQIAGTLREAARPVVAGAAELLEQIKGLRPDEVGVKFGIKVSGAANWLVAKAASEGAFEVTMTWRRPDAQVDGAGAGAGAGPASASAPGSGAEPGSQAGSGSGGSSSAAGSVGGSVDGGSVAGGSVDGPDSVTAGGGVGPESASRAV